MDNIFAEVKERIPMLDIARFYGLDVHRGGMACCPFHNDKNPSMKIYESNYYCFGCGENGDGADFVSRLFHISTYEAAKKLLYDFGISYSQSSPVVKSPNLLAEKKQFEEWSNKAFRVVSDYYKLLLKWRNDFKPKSVDDQINPLFTESLTAISRTEYLLDILTTGKKDEQMDLYKKCRSEIDNISKRLNSLKPKKKVRI